MRGPPPRRGPAPAVPRLPGGRPDISGVWERPYVPDMTKTFQNQQGPAELPYTPAGARKFKNSSFLLASVLEGQQYSIAAFL
jgi:hypothetical protein